MPDDAVTVPDGWMAARYAIRPVNVLGAPVEEGDLTGISTASGHRVVIEARIAREIVDDAGFLVMGPMVRWVGESPELGPAVQANADAQSAETEQAFKDALQRCGELFFPISTHPDGQRRSVGTMAVNGSRLLHAYSDVQAATEHHPGEPVGGVPARQVFAWVLQSPELDGLAVRCRNLNQAWCGLSRQGVQELVDLIAPPDVQELIDRLR